MRIDSKNAILELFARDYPVLQIELVDGGDAGTKTERILELARARRVEVVKKGRNKRGRKVDTRGLSPITAIVDRPKPVALREVLDQIEERDVSFLVFRELQYANNLGAVLRTAYAAGVDAVILPSVKGHDVDAEVVRVSMGASLFVPIIRMSVLSALADLSKAGVKLVAADMSGSNAYYQANLKGSAAFVLGSEAEGLTAPILERCDEVVRIPMKHDFESLNVGVSAALLVYERLRQIGSS